MACIDPDLLFVYGTLREGFVNSGRSILEEHASHLGQATVEGRLYIIQGLPALATGQGDAEVTGDLYRLDHEPRKVLALLDSYEGAAGSEPGPYERTVVQVRRRSGAKDRAWGYAWTGGLSGAQPILGGDYVSYLEAR